MWEEGRCGICLKFKYNFPPENDLLRRCLSQVCNSFLVSKVFVPLGEVQADSTSTDCYDEDEWRRSDMTLDITVALNVID